MKEKLNLSIRVSDLFNTSIWGGETNASSYHSFYSESYESRVVYLNITYNFGNTNDDYQKKKINKENQNENNDQENGKAK